MDIYVFPKIVVPLRVWFIILAFCALFSFAAETPSDSHLLVNNDGSFDFGYKNHDRGQHYHESRGRADKVVRGRFGFRNPANGRVEETVYTAGPRGFRARGPNIARKMDLSQVPRGPVGRPGDPNFDPNEDPSYEFGFRTPTYQKKEKADRTGQVNGRYSYLDDVGERHTVQYTAGSKTGFHVSSPYPDSNPNSANYLYYGGPLRRAGKHPRGKTSIQRGLDGSYRFISGGPDQRRTESSDAQGNVHGSYTFLDDKGVQRTTHYVAGPGIGYRVVKTSADKQNYPFFPPFGPEISNTYPFKIDNDFDTNDLGNQIGGNTDFSGINKPLSTGGFDTDPSSDGDISTDDIFGMAASGHLKPIHKYDHKQGSTSGNSQQSSFGSGLDSAQGTGQVAGLGTGQGSAQGIGLGTGHSSGQGTGDGSGTGSSSQTSVNNTNGGDENKKKDGNGAIFNVNGDTKTDIEKTSKEDEDGSVYKGADEINNEDNDDIFGENLGSNSGGGNKKNNDDDTLSGNQNIKPNRKGSSSSHSGSGFSTELGSSIGSSSGTGSGGSNDGSISLSGSDYEDYDYTFTRNPGLNAGVKAKGGTIFRNNGDRFIGFPPGVAVRAHVQSIDLVPLSTNLSPGDAIERATVKK